MRTLSPAELRKYDWRIPAFLERLASGSFITTSNTEVKLIYDGEGLEEKLRNESSKAVAQLKFLDENGNEYKLSDLNKDAGFGGTGSRLRHEEQAIALLQQKLEIEKYNHVSECIPIVSNGQTYFVREVVSTPGTPKSDFHFTNVDGQQVLWVSHKHGKSPRCFQQWGGCSLRNEPNIHNHEETRQFVEYIRRIEFRSAYTIARRIYDDRLKNLAVYGNDFGKEYGQNNVQLVIQGSPTLASNTANVHFDIVSHMIHTNGETMTGGYEPTFMAMYRTDRNDFGVVNCRLGISPAKARLISNWIDDEQSGPHSSHRGPDLHATGATDPVDIPEPIEQHLDCEEPVSQI